MSATLTRLQETHKAAVLAVLLCLIYVAALSTAAAIVVLTFCSLITAFLIMRDA